MIIHISNNTCNKNELQNYNSEQFVKITYKIKHRRSRLESVFVLHCLQEFIGTKPRFFHLILTLLVR